MKKVAASEVTRNRIADLMHEGFDASDLMRTGVRLMIEQALEAEVDEALGRGRYERSDEPSRGYRNGAGSYFLHGSAPLSIRIRRRETSST